MNRTNSVKFATIAVFVTVFAVPVALAQQTQTKSTLSGNAANRISNSMAAPDSEPKPTPTVCKADLKVWGAQKTEILTIEQIDTRMNEMFACADEAHHHHHSDKKMRAYLDEFYRTHSELADRAFDFITSHDLGKEFYEEKNGVGGESASNKTEEKP